MNRLTLLCIVFLVLNLASISLAQDNNANINNDSESKNPKDKKEIVTSENYEKYISFAEIAEGKLRFKTSVKYRKMLVDFFSEQNESYQKSLDEIESKLQNEESEKLLRFLKISKKLINTLKINNEIKLNECKYLFVEGEKENGGNIKDILSERKFINRRESKIRDFQESIKKFDDRKNFKQSYRYRILLKIETEGFQAFIKGKIDTYESLINRLKRMKRTKGTSAVDNAERRLKYYNWINENYTNWLESIILDIDNELSPKFNKELLFFYEMQGQFDDKIKLPKELHVNEKELELLKNVIRLRENFYKTYPPKKTTKSNKK